MSEPDWGVVPLANPSDLSDDPRLKGAKLAMNEQTGKAQYDMPPDQEAATLAGEAPKYGTHNSERQGLMGTQMGSTASLPPGTKAESLRPHDQPMTYEQLMAKAQKMLGDLNARKDAQTQQTELSQRDANGSMLPHWLTKQGY